MLGVRLGGFSSEAGGVEGDDLERGSDRFWGLDGRGDCLAYRRGRSDAWGRRGVP